MRKSAKKVSRKQTHLIERGKTYYFRMKVPADLQPIYGKQREFKVSLRTKDRNKAVIQCRVLALEKAAEFERHRVALARSRGDIEPRRITKLDKNLVDRICNLWLRETLQTDDNQRRKGLSPEELTDRIIEVAKAEVRLNDAVARGDIGPVVGALGPYIPLCGIDLDGCSDDDLKTLSYAFLKTSKKFLDAQRDRNAGKVVEVDAIVPESATLELHPTRVGSDTVTALFEEWKNAVRNRSDKTVKAFQQTVDEFNRFVGETQASLLKRKDFLRFRDHLLNVADLNFLTVEKKLSFLSAVFQLAVDNERLLANPVARIKVPRPKVPEEPREPYDDADLVKIISCPLYQEGHRPKGGGGEAAVWLPLMGMYTGARLEELGQLHVGDFHRHPTLGWYLSIRDRGEGQKVKTVSSRRDIPIHAALIEAGLLRYRDQLMRGHQTLLFPDLRPDSKGDITGNFSKWWGRYARKKIGLAETKVFHSFRHFFKDTCRSIGIEEEVHDALTGHTSSSVGRSYGAKRYPLAPLFQAMAKFSYPGLVTPILVGTSISEIAIATKKPKRKKNAPASIKSSPVKRAAAKTIPKKIKS